MSEERDDRFEECFIGLAAALRFKPDATDLRVYASALSSLPMHAIEGGAAELRIQAGRRFFPSTAEWFEAATAIVRREREEAERTARRLEEDTQTPAERRENWLKFCAEMRRVLGAKVMR